MKETASANKNNNIHMLWPTPILRKKFDQHETVNPKLVKLFYEHRRADNELEAPVYSSSDDLLLRYNVPALNQLFSFISECVKHKPALYP